MRSSSRFITVLSLAALAPLAGCFAHSDDSASGTIELPLTQPGPDGAIYHLSATFEITGPDGVPQTIDGTAFAPSVTVAEPPGIAMVQLDDGWTLERSNDGGATYQPVSALLGSANPTGLRVLANEPQQVEFDFLVRDTTGDVTIAFGVTAKPRELSGGWVIDTATGDLAAYAGKRLDFAIYFDLASMDSLTQPGGTKEHVFTAGAVAMEAFNDSIGTLAGTVAPSMTAGYLAYHVAAKPDGTQEVTGTFQGANAPFTTIDFGPDPIDPLLPLDVDGFPVDQFFYDPVLPFTQTTSFDDGDATLTGTLRMRFFP